MTSQRPKGIYHKNNLSGYISNWRLMMNGILKVKPPINIPQEFISFSDNSYDLSLMLSYLDDNLTILENKPITPKEFDYVAYAKARSFLKVCYLLLRILLDDVSGIIKYFYDKNEPQVGIPKSFDDLLKKANNGKLPKDIIALLKRSNEWFPQMRQRRVDLEHNYESLLISSRQEQDGKTVLGHFSTKARTSKEYEDIRKYFGFILCEYQKLIDNLLDHFDAKFATWYRFKPHRDITIMSDIVDLPLWWAYQYGDYKNEALQVIEDYGSSE